MFGESPKRSSSKKKIIFLVHLRFGILLVIFEVHVKTIWRLASVCEPTTYLFSHICVCIQIKAIIRFCCSLSIHNSLFCLLHVKWQLICFFFVPRMVLTFTLVLIKELRLNGLWTIRVCLPRSIVFELCVIGNSLQNELYYFN